MGVGIGHLGKANIIQNLGAGNPPMSEEAIPRTVAQCGYGPTSPPSPDSLRRASRSRNPQLIPLSMEGSWMLPKQKGVTVVLKVAH